MFEEIKNPLLLHQTRHKVKVCFAVLDAAIDLRMTRRGCYVAVIDVGIGLLQFIKNVVQNFGDRLVLKDATVRFVAKQPQPGVYLGAIIDETLIAFPLRNATDYATNLTVASFRTRR